MGESYTKFLHEFLPALTKFLTENGITEQSFIHLSDEPHISQIEHYQCCRNFVIPYIDKIQTMEALSDIEFKRRNACGLPIVSIAEVDKFLKEGYRDIFVYYCSGEINRRLSNRMIAMPLSRTRIIGLQIFLSGVKGFLHWGYNFYNDFLSRKSIDPYLVNDCGGSFSAGDPFIVYPNIERNGVRQSLRWKGIYNAFCDYRALILLSTFRGRDYCEKLLRNIGVEGFSIYPTHESFFDDFSFLIKNELKKCC